jgi:sortase B
MKKNLLTRLLALILALTMLLAVSGCGNRSVSESEEPSESASEPEEDEDLDIEYRDRVFLTDKVETGIERNSDTVGWLYIPNTTIDDAVIQYTDNDYYLRLDEDKNYSVFGCYWADYNCILDRGRDRLSRNTIIYGHSDYRDDPNGKKFSQLFHYTDLDFLKENPYIYFSTEEDDMVWQVFAVFYTHISFDYIQANPTDAVFTEIIREAKERSEYIIDLDVTKDDNILTLSTCTKYYNEADYENYRLVVMAKLLDSNSVPEECTTAMSKNPSPKKS